MNYYDILGVSRAAEADVIDAAYRAMMRRYHPDRFDGDRAEAERRSKDLNEAYAVLRSAESRAAYDRTLPPEAPSYAPSTKNPRIESSVREKSRAFRWKAISTPILTVFGLALVSWLAFRIPSPVPGKPLPINTTPVISSSEKVSPLDQQPGDLAAKNDDTPPADCRGSTCRILTPFGWAGIEAGVSVDSAARASGMVLRDDGYYAGLGDGSCLQYQAISGPKNLDIMVESGNVTVIEVYRETAGAQFSTDRGVKLGDSESVVRAKYKSLKQLPDIYSEPPDKKLFHYEPGGERGIKFSIRGGRVSSIAVGTNSIEYVEGCL